MMPSSFENGLAVTNNFLQLAPSILQLIVMIQQIITAPKAGKQKKAVVMATVPDEHKEQASAFIDTVVGQMNEASANSPKN